MNRNVIESSGDRFTVARNSCWGFAAFASVVMCSLYRLIDKDLLREILQEDRVLQSMFYDYPDDIQ